MDATKLLGDIKSEKSGSQNAEPWHFLSEKYGKSGSAHEFEAGTLTVRLSEQHGVLPFVKKNFMVLQI